MLLLRWETSEFQLSEAIAKWPSNNLEVVARYPHPPPTPRRRATASSSYTSTEIHSRYRERILAHQLDHLCTLQKYNSWTSGGQVIGQAQLTSSKTIRGRRTGSLTNACRGDRGKAAPPPPAPKKSILIRNLARLRHVKDVTNDWHSVNTFLAKNAILWNSLPSLSSQ